MSASAIGPCPDLGAMATELYAEHHAYLLSIADRNALNRDDAEEALQETFIAFIRKFDPRGGAPPLAWLTLVLKRECWQRRRSHHLDRRAGQEADLTDDELGCVLEAVPDPGLRPHERVELTERAHHLRDLLAQLKPQERRTLSLLALGYSYREIIKITGWTYTKVGSC